MKLEYLSLCVFGFLTSNYQLICSSSDLSTDNYEDQTTTRNKRDVSDSSYFYYQEPKYPRDCEEVYEQCDNTTDPGVYTIQPDGSPEPFKVYCNNTIDGGKWTVFQRRVDGSVDFYRNWDEFKNGFGFLNKEFWLGNDNLAYLTSQKDYELRIDMNNNNGDPYFAKYSRFRISDESSKYRMVDLGDYLSESTAIVPYVRQMTAGTVEKRIDFRDWTRGDNRTMGNFKFHNRLWKIIKVYDCLTHHRNMSFSTYDRENDKWTGGHCVTHGNIRGAWWWNDCGNYCNLNGLYFGCSGCYQSLNWYNLPGGRYNMKYVEMKIRARR